MTFCTRPEILLIYLFQAGSRILTANTDRVTSDPRVSIIHEAGGQVYVLLIRNVTNRDAGMYICELNTPEVNIYKN